MAKITDSPAVSIDLRREFIVRQDRVPPFLLNAFLQIGSLRYEILDCTPSKITAYSTHDFVLNQPLSHGMILIGNVMIQEVGLKILKSEQIAENRFKVLFEVEDAKVDIPLAICAHYSNEAIGCISAHNDLLETIPMDFRRTTLEVSQFFIFFKRVLGELSETLEEAIVPRGVEDPSSKILAHYLNSYLTPKLADLRATIEKAGSQIVNRSIEFFRESIGAILKEDKSLGRLSIVSRSFEDIHGNPLQKGLFRKSIFAYLMNNSTGNSLRTRSKFFKDKLVDKIKSGQDLKILAFGLSRAAELQLLLLEDLDFSRTTFHLLDSDAGTVSYVQKILKVRNLRKKAGAKFKFFNINYEDIVNGPDSSVKYDLIYAANQFDYFTSSFARLIAEKLFKSLNAGGELVIGNIDPTDIPKLLMEAAWDTSLIWRSAQEHQSIYAGLSGGISYERDTDGASIFYTVKN